MVKVRRVYEDPSARERGRFLVERLWPRGMKKERLHIDDWLKDVAPSDELRRWFGHDPQRWSEFRRKYFEELDERPQPLALLRDYLRKGPVTLLFGARDEEHNNAVALKEYLAHRARHAAASRAERVGAR